VDRKPNITRDPNPIDGTAFGQLRPERAHWDLAPHNANDEKLLTPGSWQETGQHSIGGK